MITRLIKLTLVFLAVSTLAGCALQPWVMPYETEHLANPVMKYPNIETSAGYLVHVKETRQGARGSITTGGGGCGCN